MKKTDYTTEKKYSIGISAACVLYAFIRCLFGYETNDGVEALFSVTKPDMILYIAGCLTVAVLLIVLIFTARKKEISVPEGLIPLLLISSLGEVRLTASAASSEGSPLSAISFGIFLIAAVIIFLSGFYPAAVTATVVLCIISPADALFLFIPLSVMSVPYIYGEKNSIKMPALMCTVLTVFAGIIAGIISISRSVFTPQLPQLKTSVVPVIFVLAFCGYFAFRGYKSTDKKDKALYGALCSVPVAVFICGILAGSSVNFINCGITAVASSLAVILTFCSDVNGTVRRTVENITENKILYFLVFIFVAASTAFVYVFFERTVYG